MIFEGYKLFYVRHKVLKYVALHVVIGTLLFVIGKLHVGICKLQVISGNLKFVICKLQLLICKLRFLIES